MRKREPGTGLLDQPQRFGEVQGCRPADQRGQRLARHVLHGNERRILVLADVEDRGDVLVLEPAGGTRLAREAVPRRQVEPGGQHLDGDEPIDERIAREVDGAHPASPEEPDRLVTANALEVIHWLGTGPED
jgi:hypothetical protein